MSTPVQTFGKYRLLKRLGEGGTAEVFLASAVGEAGFAKQVVIKRLHEDLNSETAFVEMLIDEARITSHLSHTNICQVLDLGSVEGAYYIAVEHVDGKDVRTLLDHCRERQALLPVEAAVHITCEVLAGLDYAHRKTDRKGNTLGIIHRDVSPQNILISYEGEVKLSDFGIAKAMHRLARTQVGMVKGKLLYMSPEQASGRSLDQRSDIFSTGVVLYELLRGAPYADQKDSDIVLQMRKAGLELEPVSRHRADTPKKLEAIVQQAVKPRPEDRFATAREFRSALQRFLHDVGVSFDHTELAKLMQGWFGTPAGRSDDGAGTGLPYDATVPAIDLPGSDPRRTLDSRRTLSEVDPVPTKERDMSKILERYEDILVDGAAYSTEEEEYQDDVTPHYPYPPWVLHAEKASPSGKKKGKPAEAEAEADDEVDDEDVDEDDDDDTTVDGDSLSGPLLPDDTEIMDEAPKHLEREPDDDEK